MLIMILYLAICALTSMWIYVIQRYCLQQYKEAGNSKKIEKKFFALSMFMMFVILFMYGFRYGIGVDYLSYEKIYDALHEASFTEYFTKNLLNLDLYYVEFAYYLLNRILPSFTVVNIIVGILIYSMLFCTLKKYMHRINIGFAVWIFLCWYFLYSMNVVRFAIAVVIILYGFQYIFECKFWKFLLCIIIAALFHKTALFCLLLYFMAEFQNKKINRIRNVILMFSIVTFPILIGVVMDLLIKIPLFSRYFSSVRYSTMKLDFSLGWLIYVIPVLFPLLIFGREKIKASADTNVMFRIYLLQIPLYILSLYNEVYSRLVRYSQIVEILLIPLIIMRFKNKKTRISLMTYYIILYLFYFVFFELVVDKGLSLDYKFVFFNHN